MHTLKKFQKIQTGTKFVHLYRGEYDVDGRALQHEISSRKDEGGMTGGASLGHGADAVCIVPFFGNGDVLATKEFRYAVNAYCLEFPAGLIEPGEGAVEAAMRELKEETGLDTRRVLFSVPGGFSSAGMTDEKVAVVGLEVSGSYHDVCGKEEIHPFRTTLQELWERVMKGGEECSSRMQCFLPGCQAAGNPAFPGYAPPKEGPGLEEGKKRDIFGGIARGLRDYPEGGVWSTGDEILCRTESAANAMADMLQALYKAQGEEITVNTGYYDPEEDGRNRETDRCTGWWYVNIP